MGIFGDRRVGGKIKKPGFSYLCTLFFGIVVVFILAYAYQHGISESCPVCPSCDDKGRRMGLETPTSAHSAVLSLPSDRNESDRVVPNSPTGTLGSGNEESNNSVTSQSKLLPPPTSERPSPPPPTPPPSSPALSSSPTPAVVEVEEEEEPPPPLLILVTPTHNRAAQAFHVSQVVSVLRVVPPPILWIVVEAKVQSPETIDLLNRTAGKCLKVGIAKKCTTVNYVHLATPEQAENKTVSRGVRQRNYALDYIQDNRIKGIVYFMDDDNAYTPELFHEIRKVKRVGVFPVGLLWSHEYQTLMPYRQTSPFVERPLVRLGANGEPEVYAWETFEWAFNFPVGQGRKFNIDMAGFAFNSELLWEPRSNVTNRPKHPVRFVSKLMFLETNFLNKLIPKDSYLEPLADMCQDVHVWHVKFESKPYQPYPERWRLVQPKEIQRDFHPVRSISRYLKGGRRYKVKGYNSTIPFGYTKKDPPPGEKDPQKWRP